MNPNQPSPRLNLAHEIPLYPYWPESLFDQIKAGQAWVVVPVGAIEFEEEEAPTL